MQVLEKRKSFARLYVLKDGAYVRVKDADEAAREGGGRFYVSGLWDRHEKNQESV